MAPDAKRGTLIMSPCTQITNVVIGSVLVVRPVSYTGHFLKDPAYFAWDKSLLCSSGIALPLFAITGALLRTTSLLEI